jgi:hypothetical protein
MAPRSATSEWRAGGSIKGMGEERRRSGFRLSWTANDQRSEDEARHDEAATDAAAPAVDTMTADAPTNAAPVGETPATAMPAPATEAVAAAQSAGDAVDASGGPDASNAPVASDEPDASAAAPAGGAATADGESSEFLVSLVGAMRGVAEASRDASLADFRTAVDAHIEQLNADSAEKESDLRRAADVDLQGIGDWERDETERIKSEAESRRDARRTRLDQQLTEHHAASEREVEASRARLADHERDLAAFFTQLGEISDPAAFVAAAKRMPRAPDLSSPMSAPTAPEPVAETASAAPTGDPRLAAMRMTAETAETDPATPAAAAGEAAADAAAGAATDVTVEPAAGEPAATESDEASADNRLAARLAQLDQHIAGDTQPVAAAAPAPSNGGDQSTAVIVKGLGSFGAITSFKQALERVEGIRGVTLSLGPTGEFVYRASHAADFDMAAAVQSVEGPSATVEDTDGTLVVTLSRAR